MSKAQTTFELSVSGRDDGTLEALYIQILNEPVDHTEEIQEDVLLADYSADGRLIGIEILSPIRLSDLEKLVQNEMQEPFRRFVERSMPRDLVMA